MFDPSIGLLGNLSFRISFKVTTTHPDESGRVGTKCSTGTPGLIHAKSGVTEGWSPDF